MRKCWREVTLGDVVELIPGKYVPKSEYVDDGPFFIYGSNSVMGKYSKALINVPHTVMAAIGAYAGAVRYSPEPSWVNNNAFGLVANSETEPKFLFLWLENILDLKSVVAGTVQPYVQRPLLKAVRINLPSQLEQKRIVDLVSSVDSYIAALQQQADAARVARNAVLSELLSAGGEDWIETTLGDVAEWYSGGTPKAGRSEYYDGGDIPWVVIADLMKTEIYETATRITPAGLAEIGGRLAPVGSVLISMYATVGRSGITHVPVATNQAIAWSVPNTELVLPRFLLLIAQSLENEISSMGRGATQRNINRAMLREFTFQLPPIEEQGRIVEIVSSIDDLIESTEHAVADAKHLRSGLLLDLLSGSHEIPESYDRLLGAA
jgi:restriction endonuclease S subunit